MRLVILSLLLACNQSAGQGGAAAPPAPAAPEGSAAPASSAPTAALKDDAVVATWQGGQLTYGQLKQEIGGQLTKLEVEYLTNRYDTETGGLDRMVVDQLLGEEAKAQGKKDIEALLKSEIEDKVTPPTDAEISLTYEMMKRRMGDVPLEQVKEKVVADLMRRKQGELFQTYITALKERKGVKTSLPFPDMPRIQVSVDDDPVRGPETAPVTIIQFAEFQCPYCGKASAAVEQVFKEYDGKVKMVFRDFPLGFHDRAIPAAVAANCAGQQGKYWEMHNQLMSNQRALEDADLEAAARTVEVDINKWQACRKDPAQEAEVRKDLEDGQAAGVSGTPAFFINGIMLSGAQPFSEFKAIIDRELSKG